MLGKLYHIGQGICSRGRNLIYRALGVNIVGYVWMRKIHIPRMWSTIRLENGVALDHEVQLMCSGDSNPNKLVIGKKTYINRFTTLDAHSDLQIGDSCMIGPYCYITDADHEKIKGISISKQPMKASYLHIGDEVWIGSHVVILPGVTIGKGAIIGAGSVVTSDIPEDTIAYGVPAKVQSKRSAKA